MNRSLFFLITLIGIATSGCSTLGYLYQAAEGQLELNNKARPIRDMIEDERTSPHLKRLLSEIEPIKKFGEKYGLKPTSNYEEYVKLDRPYVVWVVTACPPLQFKPKQWSFPIVGSFTYLGWFDQEKAEELGKELSEKNYDVYVRGASAFSTLGWFRDPILSTMIDPGDAAFGDLVNVVLHESVHASIYIEGQSYFNESIATFVANQLTDSYLQTADRVSEAEVLGYQSKVEKRQAFKTRMFQAYHDLEKIYQSELFSDQQKLTKKNEVITRLKSDLKLQKEINNAALVQYRTYDVGLSEFEVLFQKCQKDWDRFWKVVNQLSPKSFSQEQQEDFGNILTTIAQQGCEI